MNNVEDASAEYIQTTGSQEGILNSFREKWPEIMSELEANLVGRQLTFIEQYDPEDESGDQSFSQPYAFVADRVVELAVGAQSLSASIDETGRDVTSPTTPRTPKSPRSVKSIPTPSKSAFYKALVNPQSLSVNVEDVVAEGPGLSAKGWEALASLRDKLAAGEKIGWWVVYNGDPQRWYDGKEDEEEYDTEEEMEELLQGTTFFEQEDGDEDDRTVTLEDPKPKQKIVPKRPPGAPDMLSDTMPLRDSKRETGKRKPVANQNNNLPQQKTLPPVRPTHIRFLEFVFKNFASANTAAGPAKKQS